MPPILLGERKEQRGAMNQSQKAQAERPGRAAQCHTWAAGLYFKCCVANICRMNSKLGEGEGAGWRRCSKLGAELRQGWLLGADGGRAGAGACASCVAAAPAPALHPWGARPRGGGMIPSAPPVRGEQESLDGQGGMPGHPGHMQAGLRWHKGDLWCPSAQLLAPRSPQRHLSPWHGNGHCIPCLPQAARDMGRPSSPAGSPLHP